MDFKPSTVLTLDEVKNIVMSPALDWETVLIVDGLQPGYIQGCRGEGYSIISYMNQDVYTPSQMKYRSLLAFYLEKGTRVGEGPGMCVPLGSRCKRRVRVNGEVGATRGEEGPGNVYKELS